MARWIILLFVYSVVNGQGSKINLTTLRRCCKAGRFLALGQNCTRDPPVFISSSVYCGLTQERCCSAAELDRFCENGIDVAEDNGVCDELSFPEDPPQGVLSKLCCDCCKLGLTQVPTCRFTRLLLGDLCLDAAKGCCERQATVIEQTTHAPVTESPQVSSTTESHDPCRDLNCSQLCEGNGTCACFAGYKLQDDGVSCQAPVTESPQVSSTTESHDPCRDLNCSQLCEGNGTCACFAGYKLQDDGVSCQDINECAWHNRGHQCSYSCANVPGSFHCTCPSTGYTLAPNERTCQDIDECALGTHTCPFHGSCFNILGGFRCLSLACPQYFQLAGHGKDTSASWNCYKSCHPQDFHCYNYRIDMINYISLSLETFHAIRDPKEILFLQSNVAASYPHVYGATDVSFKMLVADDQSSFDVIKRSHGGMFVGVVHQVKPIRGPRDLVLQVAMDYVKGLFPIAALPSFMSSSRSPCPEQSN
uniref:EGF-like domain-containing protein n=1 Tax=Gasterosteus aculeatus aculeatus TaxID=481459 RepID=A0AAQ4RSY8_GASAC